MKDTKEDFSSRVVNLLMVSKMTKPAGHNSMANAFRKMRIEVSKCQDVQYIGEDSALTASHTPALLASHAQFQDLPIIEFPLP